MFTGDLLCIVVPMLSVVEINLLMRVSFQLRIRLVTIFSRRPSARRTSRTRKFCSLVVRNPSGVGLVQGMDHSDLVLAARNTNQVALRITGQGCSSCCLGSLRGVRDAL